MLLDDTTPRPITNEIERLSEVYASMRSALISLLPEVARDDDDGLSLLGHDPVDLRPFLLSQALRESPSIERIARGLINAMCA